VPKSGIREIFDLSQGIPGLIDLGIGEPDFNAPSFVREAAKKAIDGGFGKYTPNAGLPELKEEISNKLRQENGIVADPKSEIIVTAGATQAIFVLMHCLLNAGDQVLLPTPLFPAYKSAATLAGGIPVEVPVLQNKGGGVAVDFSALEERTSDKTKLLVLNSPCNPTGAVVYRDSIQEICEFAARKNLYLVSDEIYEKYVYDTHHYSPASNPRYRDRIITINGFAKTYGMTGWRLGYAAANEEIIAAMTRFNMFNAVCATSFVQIAAIAALRHSLDFFQSIRRRYEKKSELVCKYLDEMGWTYLKPRGAFYIFPKLPTRFPDSLSFSKRLLENQKVAIVPGTAFGAGGEEHVRISYALKESKLIEGLTRLRKFAAQE
jgi:aminotransferase